MEIAIALARSRSRTSNLQEQPMRLPLPTLAVALCLAVSSTALANSPAPDAFGVPQVEGNKVKLDHLTQSLCGSETLLRKNLATGEVVSLGHENCTNDEFGNEVLIDECVPKGNYQYGFRVLPVCADDGDSFQYYADVSVTAELGACSRSPDLAAPKAYSGTVPWGESRSSDCGGGCSAAGGGAPAGLLLIALSAAATLLVRSRK